MVSCNVELGPYDGWTLSRYKLASDVVIYIKATTTDQWWRTRKIGGTPTAYCGKTNLENCIAWLCDSCMLRNGLIW